VPGDILREHPFLAHVVRDKLGTHNVSELLYGRNESTEWRRYDTIHLLLGHRWYNDAGSPIKKFNKVNIVDYNRTYGHMCRDIMRRMRSFIKPSK
jgi:hypothetical protein